MSESRVRPFPAAALVHALDLFLLGTFFAAHYFALVTKQQFVLGVPWPIAMSGLFAFALFVLALLNALSFVCTRVRLCSALLTSLLLAIIAAVHLSRVATHAIPMQILGHSVSPSSSLHILFFAVPLCFANLWLTITYSNSSTAKADPSNVFPLLYRTIQESPPHIAKLLGLATFAIVATPTAIVALCIAHAFLVTDGLFTCEQINELAWIGFVGGQGAIISVLSRIRVRDDEKQCKNGLNLYFLRGLCRPVIGMTFAHFSYFLLHIGLLTVPTSDSKEYSPMFVYVTVAFVAGFSERFATNLLTFATDTDRSS